MIRCNNPRCSYTGNPDEATTCILCKAPLARRDATLNEEEHRPQRGSTAIEELPSSSRRQTALEGLLASSGAPRAAEEPVFAEPHYANPVAATPQTPVAQAKPAAPAMSDQAQRRRTVYIGTPVEDTKPAASVSAAAPRAQAPVAAPAGRKIVGILITYSWKEQGEIFPVLEGRNLIGKDPDQCDICVPQDATLSAVNSFITFRRNFIVGDRVSMSGTDVDGEPIETEFVPLRNYATIRTGSTHWIFVAIQPPASAPPA